MSSTRPNTLSRDAQVWDQNVKTTPVRVQRSLRTDHVDVLTSGYAGKMLPIKMIPLLREDALETTVLRMRLEMSETADMLINPVNVSATAWLVPKLAMERFSGMDSLNDSYNKVDPGSGIVPWFETTTWATGAPGNYTANEFFKTLGMHGRRDSNDVNADYLEAYNIVWNHRAKQRSSSLTLRTKHDNTLAPAFWRHTQMKHIKPDFDQALIDGQVPINPVGDVKAPISGLGWGASMPTSSKTYRATGGLDITHAGGQVAGGSAGGPDNVIMMDEDPSNPGYPAVYADITTALGGSFSLADIDLARETAAFARLRQQYQGLNDDNIIDLLMQGIRIPEQQLKHPMLIARNDTSFGMSQRFASDSGNLDKSVTRGFTELDLRLRAPAMNTGAIVVVCVEILPEQLYERQADHYLLESDPDNLPNYLQDYLDPEPVSVVPNHHVDVSHSALDDWFGYAPLNYQWQRQGPNIGGRFYRNDPNEVWREDRNRIWAVEQVDPQLGTDFYIASNIHHQVFADANTDPFEINLRGIAAVRGNTFFGPALRDSDGDYDYILNQVDQARIDKDAVETPATSSQSDSDDAQD